MEVGEGEIAVMRTAMRRGRECVTALGFSVGSRVVNGLLVPGVGFNDTIFIAVDEAAYKTAAAFGLTVLHPRHLAGMSRKMDGHLASQSSLFCILHQVVELGYHALLHDVDIAWMKDPFVPILHAPESINADIQSQLAPRWDAHGVLNSGFVLFRANPRTALYLRTMVELTPLMYWLHSDQVVYNSLLRHWRFRAMTLQIIKRGIFVDLHTDGEGKGGTLKSFVSNETRMVHVIRYDALAIAGPTSGPTDPPPSTRHLIRHNLFLASMFVIA
ncbi:hypothetical protein CYMTET_53474 [Cymbomonas tetramitiformis]|uniref:Nucleotide-diphospho-sugar transferase domain-containing protein n=1 Tax=Cymbomonas tetramitiformis TaxID=36881 RepID=A0AAE0BIN9_9CHLO|nr:hypothetical protein CYMTET_53474 [Cymbomonas tetramitiformis]